MCRSTFIEKVSKLFQGLVFCIYVNQIYYIETYYYQDADLVNWMFFSTRYFGIFYQVIKKLIMFDIKAINEISLV